jgi:CheY-like chemotaxis protein
LLSGANIPKLMSGRLLIVEDDVDVADMLAEIFATRGYKVIVAGNGQEALDRVRWSSFAPNVILLDLVMPVMDGLAFLKARKTEPLLANVPIIVTTTEPDVGPLPLDVYARFTKPVALELLVDAVHVAREVTRVDGPERRDLRSEPDERDE